MTENSGVELLKSDDTDSQTPSKKKKTAHSSPPLKNPQKPLYFFNVIIRF